MHFTHCRTLNSNQRDGVYFVPNVRVTPGSGEQVMEMTHRTFAPITRKIVHWGHPMKLWGRGMKIKEYLSQTLTVA
ncbi:hypothetical protein D3C75_1066160 [compost metagenome]